MDQVDEVKSKVDLVEIVSSYIPLKKMGRNYGGLCPFHAEKTPSFMVSPERQVFKCFGCGQSGDIFTFLEKVEGWDFREALNELAEKVGIKLKSFAPAEGSKRKEKLIAVNTLAAKFFSHLLINHKLGRKARNYLVKRGIKQKMWELFNLGYAPGGWENLLGFLAKRGFLLDDIAASGLVVSREGVNLKDRGKGYYDRFRDRLIFPIKDARGTILGFSARVLEESNDRKEPKYINTPQTQIFNKGSLLFGLDLARDAIRNAGEAILAEGEFDVISAYQAGIRNIVASKGTALTDKQTALIARLTENVVLAFDADLAGDTAARRGIELLDLAGVTVKVAKLESYKDPDEFCQKDPAGFKKIIAGAVNIYDYYIDSLTKRYNPKSVEGQKKISKELLPILSKISDDLVRAHYIEELARLLDVDSSLVAAAIEKRLAQLDVPQNTFNNIEAKKAGLTLETYFLALFVFEDKIDPNVLKFLKPADFTDKQAQSFWKAARDIIPKRSQKLDQASPKDTKKLLGGLPADLKSFVDELYLININPAFDDPALWFNEILKTANRIRDKSQRRKLTEIAVLLGEAQKKGDSRRIEALTQKSNEIAKNLENDILKEQS